MMNVFEEDIYNAMNQALEGSFEHINQLDEFPLSKAKEVVAVLLSFACKGQNHAHINVSRKIMLQIPIVWLVENMKSVVEKTIDYNDEWEYRRLLELAELLSKDLLIWVIEIGRNSDNEEVREASEDFEDKIV